MEKITLSFTHEKDTKGTHRYAEDGEKGNHVVGTLYIKKKATGSEDAPKTLRVTIESQE